MPMVEIAQSDNLIYILTAMLFEAMHARINGMNCSCKLTCIDSADCAGVNSIWACVDSKYLD